MRHFPCKPVMVIGDSGKESNIVLYAMNYNSYEHRTLYKCYHSKHKQERLGLIQLAFRRDSVQGVLEVKKMIKI